MAVVRILGALVLLLVAASSPVMGYGAAEHYSGRRFYGVLEGDWLFWFALIAGGAALWLAIDILRRRSSVG